MSQENELLSAVGVDYSPLRDLLVAGQWQKADEETGAIMLKIALEKTPTLWSSPETTPLLCSETLTPMRA